MVKPPNCFDIACRKRIFAESFKKIKPRRSPIRSHTAFRCCPVRRNFQGTKGLLRRSVRVGHGIFFLRAEFRKGNSGERAFNGREARIFGNTSPSVVLVRTGRLQASLTLQFRPEFSLEGRISSWPG